jgi:hypothetical protein
VERLAKNIGGYRGETIDIRQILRDIEAAAREKNWARDVTPIENAAQPMEFVAYRRAVASPRTRVYLSAGIHGDEPAGPLAMLQLLREHRWPADAAIWLCPCLNPTGFPLNRRENFQGIDLNRDYRHQQSAEVRAHVKWLEQQPSFDYALCLHEDWEANGFYVYEVNPDQRPTLSEKIVSAVAEACPIEHAALVDNWTAEKGVIRPAIIPAERPQWPEALYLITHKTRLSNTLEAPSDYPLPVRVAALVTAVNAALQLL